MSNHYDGKRIYEYARGTQAKYEIRGNLIHEHARGTQAVYEIRLRTSWRAYRVRLR
jgi:hypothetical protein